VKAAKEIDDHFMGNTAQSIVWLAPCPVLLAK
jgi:nucleotide-binding universal stress UspA family protein